MNNKIKQHRLAQLGIIKLTARQKNRVAKLCKCSKTHIESVLSDQHDTINYKILYFAAVETQNKEHVKKYHRPIYEQKQK